jgi:hypothetical protein
MPPSSTLAGFATALRVEDGGKDKTVYRISITLPNLLFLVLG